MYFGCKGVNDKHKEEEEEEDEEGFEVNGKAEHIHRL